jgi:Ricin-type beta-trefoil lectin domain-like/Peptidase family M23
MLLSSIFVQITMTVRSKFLLLTSALVGFSAISATTANAADWKMPWKANVSAGLTRYAQGFHPDGFVGNNSIDIGLPAGSDVLAPVDSKVVAACLASGGNNQWAIKFLASDNQAYSLIHVSVGSNPVGKTFKQGEKIGTVAYGTVNDPKCAISDGPHLHFGLPSQNVVIDGQGINYASAYRGRQLTSHNSGNRIPDVTMLVSKETNGALDGCGGSNGTELYIHRDAIIWSTCQKWQLRNVGNDEYMIINQQTQRPLDGGGATGVNPYLHPQQLGNRPQKWKLQQSDDGYMLINVDSGRVLDSGGASAPRAYMFPYAIPGHRPHIWKFQ